MVCIDAANWNPSLNQSGIRIDWREFKILMEQMFTTVDLHYYDGLITDRWYRKNRPDCTKKQLVVAKKNQKNFFNKLKEFGYRVVSKPIAAVFDKQSQEYKYKCNFDVEVAVDVMDRLDQFDVLVLGSGDGDFVALVKHLKSKLKETYGIAAEGRFSSKLKEIVSYYDYLNNLLFWVQGLKQKK